MLDIKRNSFSTTLNVVKKGTVATLCMVMMGLFLAVGCKKDNPTTSGGGTGGGKTDGLEYPIDVPFTEYSLEETMCNWLSLTQEEWEDLNSEPQVIIINSDSELKNYLSCAFGESSYPEVNFSRQTLLLARGMISRGYLVCSGLQQLSEQKYEMKVDCFTNWLPSFATWYVPIIVNKLSEECTVELIVTHKEFEE